MRTQDFFYYRFLITLGSCSVCTSRAFLFCVGLWIIYALSAGALGALLLFAALVATFLWLSHLIAYAMKNATRLPREYKSENLLAKRRSLQFLRYMGAAMLTSMLPTTAFAMGSCGSCGQGIYSNPQCYRDDYNGGCIKCHSCGSGECEDESSTC